MGHVVVVGAGQAGSSCVAKLRNSGFEGEITLIGAETAPPYQRPPLSKGYLLGEMTLERMYLRPESFYAENGIELILGAEVSGVDQERASSAERVPHHAPRPRLYHVTHDETHLHVHRRGS